MFTHSDIWTILAGEIPRDTLQYIVDASVMIFLRWAYICVDNGQSYGLSSLHRQPTNQAGRRVVVLPKKGTQSLPYMVMVRFGQNPRK